MWEMFHDHCNLFFSNHVTSTLHIIFSQKFSDPDQYTCNWIMSLNASL